mmetsp:Transcript_5926/g.11097  ORF Transcript_5926/g.11097 Transcript_5926/m.11097 type:complete len:97 (-) Transcript_5926:2024-2314(-)
MKATLQRISINADGPNTPRQGGSGDSEGASGSLVGQSVVCRLWVSATFSLPSLELTLETVLDLFGGEACGLDETVLLGWLLIDFEGEVSRDFDGDF